MSGLISPNSSYCTYSALLALTKNFLCFLRMSSVEILVFWSFYRQSETKSLNSGDHFSYLFRPGEFICKMFIKAFMGGRSICGTQPSAISRAIIPSDHTSDLKSYPSFCSIFSGAIQQGEPTNAISLFSIFNDVVSANLEITTCPFSLTRM